MWRRDAIYRVSTLPMSVLSKIIQLFLIVLSCVCWACQSGDAINRVPTPSQNVVVSTPPVSTTPVSPEACQQYLKNFPQATAVQWPEPKVLKIEIDSNRIYDEASLAKWMAEFSDQVFSRPECDADKLIYTAGLSEASFYQGISKRDDYQSFKKNKISEAEWFRRFEIAKTETIASIKAALKAARDKEDNAVALGLVEKLLEKEPENLNAKIIKANILLDQQAYVEAMANYKVLSEQSPNNLLILFNLAYAQKEAGSFSDAIATYQGILGLMGSTNSSLASVSPDAVWLNVADGYLKNNEQDQAEKALAQVQNVQDINFKILKANLFRTQGKLSEAKEILSSLTNTGAPALAWFNLTLIHLDLKDVPLAQQSFDQLKLLDPEMAAELSFLEPFKKKSENVLPVIIPTPQDSTAVLPVSTTTEPVPVPPTEPSGDTVVPSADEPLSDEEDGKDF